MHQRISDCGRKRIRGKFCQQEVALAYRESKNYAKESQTKQRKLKLLFTRVYTHRRTITSVQTVTEYWPVAGNAWCF